MPRWCPSRCNDWSKWMPRWCPRTSKTPWWCLHFLSVWQCLTSLRSVDDRFSDASPEFSGQLIFWTTLSNEINQSPERHQPAGTAGTPTTTAGKAIQGFRNGTVGHPPKLLSPCIHERCGKSQNHVRHVAVVSNQKVELRITWTQNLPTVVPKSKTWQFFQVSEIPRAT